MEEFFQALGVVGLVILPVVCGSPPAQTASRARGCPSAGTLRACHRDLQFAIRGVVDLDRRLALLTIGRPGLQAESSGRQCHPKATVPVGLDGDLGRRRGPGLDPHQRVACRGPVGPRHASMPRHRPAHVSRLQWKTSPLPAHRP